MYNQRAAALGRSLNYPVRPGINTLLLSTGALGSFTCSGMTHLIYMGPTALHVIRAMRDKQSPMLKARFLHLTILVTQPGIQPQNLDYQANMLTTRPRLSQKY